jgi:hypothetical protein
MMVTAMCALNLDTLLESVQIVKALKNSNRNIGVWLFIYLQSFQFVVHLSGGLIHELIFMCALMYLCFLLIRPEGLPPCLWETGCMH